MNDQRMETIIGELLRAGVVLAATVVACGGVWYLMTSGDTPVSYRHFSADVRGLGALGTLPRPEALIFAGLLVLIATPVMRVVFSLVAFVMEGDRMYVVATAAVLVTLLYSMGTAWW